MKKIGDISYGEFRQNDNASCYINFHSFGNFFESGRKNSCISLLCNNNSFWKKVPVFFLEPDEMKIFETKSNEKIIYKRMIKLLEQTNFTQDDLYHVLKKEDSDDKYSCVRELLGGIKEKDDALYKKLLSLFSTIIFDGNLFGIYKHNASEKYPKGIYLCPENIEENIEDECKESKIQFDDLIKSVLVHEYTHYLHINNMDYYELRKEESRVYRSAVLETVAESIQALYMDYIGNSECIKWINSHSKGNYKLFPGWGYKGWSILSEYCDNHARCKSKFNLLEIIIELSLSSWREAYSFINTVDKLNHI